MGTPNKVPIIWGSPNLPNESLKTTFRRCCASGAHATADMAESSLARDADPASESGSIRGTKKRRTRPPAGEAKDSYVLESWPFGLFWRISDDKFSLLLGLKVSHGRLVPASSRAFLTLQAQYVTWTKVETQSLKYSSYVRC